MNLIVDIGNSFIKVAVVEHDEVLELRRYQSLEEFAGSNIVAEFPFYKGQ
jgi:pantothenate kinase type III